MNIRLAVVDDHPLLVGGLTAALSTIADIELVGSGATVADARRFLDDKNLDVVLLDVRLEDGNGLAALAERTRVGGPCVIVISSFTTSQYIAAARRYGAAGYLLKTVPLVELVSAIRRVCDGESVFSAEQRERQFVELTASERQVLGLAMGGLSNKEIGRIVGTSRKGVEAHLSDLYARYDIRGGRVELLLRAVDEGWLEVEDRPLEGTGRARTRRARKVSSSTNE